MYWGDTVVTRLTLSEPGLRVFAAAAADFVLLDAGDVYGSGVSVLGQIRQVSDVPLIMLTDPHDEFQQVRALQLGAHDCVDKPFSPVTLRARIKAVLRRARFPLPVDAATNFVVGGMEMRFEDHLVMRAGQPVKLTPMEYGLLYQLVRNAVRLMPHEALLQGMTGGLQEHHQAYLRMFIYRLRVKLETPSGRHYIQTEHRRGYRFVA